MKSSKKPIERQRTLPANTPSGNNGEHPVKKVYFQQDFS